MIILRVSLKQPFHVTHRFRPLLLYNNDESSFEYEYEQEFVCTDEPLGPFVKMHVLCRGQ